MKQTIDKFTATVTSRALATAGLFVVVSLEPQPAVLGKHVVVKMNTGLLHANHMCITFCIALTQCRTHRKFMFSNLETS